MRTSVAPGFTLDFTMAALATMFLAFALGNLSGRFQVSADAIELFESLAGSLAGLVYMLAERSLRLRILLFMAFPLPFFMSGWLISFIQTISVS